ADPLTLHYTLSGTATAGLDYVAPSGTFTFAAGSATASVDLTPIDDWLVEGDESVVLSILPDSAYNLAAAYSATLTLSHNELIDTQLLPPGAIWKYLGNGTNQGTAWYSPTFNDSAWASGSAKLGYGVGAE